MSKPKKSERYEYCRAIRDAEGHLRWEYKVQGLRASGMSHDEDVSEFSNNDIVKLTRAMLSMEPDEKVEVFDE